MEVSTMNPATARLVEVAKRSEYLLTELQILSESVQLSNFDEFEAVIVDFGYLQAPRAMEEKIRSDSNLNKLDESFHATFDGLLSQFRDFFSGCLGYHEEFLKLLEEIEAGESVHCDIETVFSSSNGVQIIVEALHSHSCLFTMIEHLLGKELREKILMALLRHRGAVELENFESLRFLCKRVPDNLQWSKPSFLPYLGLLSVENANYPSVMNSRAAFEFSSRFLLPNSLIRKALVYLQHEEIFETKRFFPDPQIKSIPFSRQASSALSLLFQLEVDLEKDKTLMEGIVQRYFSDHWIVPLYFGYCIDLQQLFDRFPAARAALARTLVQSTVKKMAAAKLKEAMNCQDEMSEMMEERLLSVEYVLRNSSRLQNLIRLSNSLLQWFVLHSCASSSRLREIIMSVVSVECGEFSGFILTFLLDAAKFENTVREKLILAYDNRDKNLLEESETAAKSLEELSLIFSGSQILSGSRKDDNLTAWFSQLSSEILSLDLSASQSTIFKLQKIISALSDVQHFHQIDASLAVRQQVETVGQGLEKMVLLLNLSDRALKALDSASRMDYAFPWLTSHAKTLHAMIARDTRLCSSACHLFLKLGRAKHSGIFQFLQSDSSVEEGFVSHFQRSKLSKFATEVMECIPRIVAQALTEAMPLQMKLLQSSEVSQKQPIQANERLQLTKLTNKISVLCHGALSMQESMADILNVSFRGILEEGLRRFISHKVKSLFAVSSQLLTENLEVQLRALSESVRCTGSSFIVFQDFLRVQTGPMFKREADSFLDQSASKAYFSLKNQGQETGLVSAIKEEFMGSVFLLLLNLSNPQKTLFLAPLTSWFNERGQEQVGLRLVQTLHKCIGAVGFAGLDLLLRQSACQSMGAATAALQAERGSYLHSEMKSVEVNLSQAKSSQGSGPNPYSEVLSKLSTPVTGALTAVTMGLAAAGQAQLLRALLAFQNQSASATETRSLYLGAQNLNSSLLAGINNGPSNSVSSLSPDFLQSFSRQLSLLGLQDPTKDSFPSVQVPPNLETWLFLLTIRMMRRYVYDSHLACLVSRSSKNAIDFTSLVVGVSTLLRQCSKSVTVEYCRLMGHYVNSLLLSGPKSGQERKLPPDSAASRAGTEAQNCVIWLLALASNVKLPHRIVEDHVSPFLRTFLPHVGLPS